MTEIFSPYKKVNRDKEGLLWMTITFGCLFFLREKTALVIKSSKGDLKINISEANILSGKFSCEGQKLKYPWTFWQTLFLLFA